MNGTPKVSAKTGKSFVGGRSPCPDMDAHHTKISKINPMTSSLCLSLPVGQNLPPAGSAFRNFSRFFAASFFAGPEREKAGLDQDKPGYSGIKGKIRVASSHLISHKNNLLFFDRFDRRSPFDLPDGIVLATKKN